MKLHELLDKPVWQMTGEELLFLAQHGKMHDEGEVTVKSSAKEQKHFVYYCCPINVKKSRKDRLNR